MDILLKEFEQPSLLRSQVAQKRWKILRTAKNPLSRFRMVVDLVRKSEDRAKLLKTQGDSGEYIPLQAQAQAQAQAQDEDEEEGGEDQSQAYIPSPAQAQVPDEEVEGDDQSQAYIPSPAQAQVQVQVQVQVQDESARQMPDSTLHPIQVQDESARQMPDSTLTIQVQDEESASQMQDSTLGPTQNRQGRRVRSISIDLIKEKLNILLPFGPLAILLHHLMAKHAWVFFFCLLGMSPLEERIGYVTNQLALYYGPTVGGLLNATFGSTTEMIISIVALKKGMIRVVQLSLLGSILSHMLLLLGCAFFTSGIFLPQEDQETALVSLGLPLMAVISMFFPSVLNFTHTEVHSGISELYLSRFISFILLVAYASYLLFQLKGQYNLRDPSIEMQERDNHAEDSVQEESSEIVLWEAIGWLAILTVWQSIVSEYLIDSIQGASDSWNMSVDFVSVILIPAAVCANTIVFAMKERFDNTRLQSVIGFSTQIIMFVERTSNHFRGLMLILCYFIVAASFFVHVDPSK